MRDLKFAACATLCFLASCNDGDLCTTDFAMVQVTAVTAAGDPVAGLAIRDSLTRTGHAFDIMQMSGTRLGDYQVFTDGHRRELPREVETVRVTGTDGARGFTADFVFRAGECHIAKLSGPDTVVVTP